MAEAVGYMPEQGHFSIQHLSPAMAAVRPMTVRAGYGIVKLADGRDRLQVDIDDGCDSVE